jgi:hypothetical protein
MLWQWQWQWHQFQLLALGVNLAIQSILKRRLYATRSIQEEAVEMQKPSRRLSSAACNDCKDIAHRLLLQGAIDWARSSTRKTLFRATFA